MLQSSSLGLVAISLNCLGLVLSKMQKQDQNVLMSNHIFKWLSWHTKLQSQTQVNKIVVYVVNTGLHDIRFSLSKEMKKTLYPKLRVLETQSRHKFVYSRGCLIPWLESGIWKKVNEMQISLKTWNILSTVIETCL